MIRQFLERISRDVVIKRTLPASFGSGSIIVSPGAGLRYWKRNLRSIDPVLLNAVKEMVNPGDVVWDVGANVGLFSFAAAGTSGPSGGVLAIEPDIFLVNLLRKSALLGRPTAAAVSVLPVAVAESVCVTQFNIACRSRASNYLEGAGGSQAGGSRERHLVMTVSLDWLLDHFPAPNVLKIDVEGVEDKVLLGGTRLLREVRPRILCEVSEANRRVSSEILKSNGYVLFDAEDMSRPRRQISSAAWNTFALPITV